MENNRKCGFVAIIGKPNVGKSTLLNTMLGEKIAIVSSKPQTTRTSVTGSIFLSTRPVYINRVQGSGTIW